MTNERLLPGLTSIRGILGRGKKRVGWMTAEDKGVLVDADDSGMTSEPANVMIYQTGDVVGSR